MNLPALSFVLTIIFISATIFTQIDRRDLSAVRDTLSKYALGKYGWVLTIAMYSMVASQIILAQHFTLMYGATTGPQLLKVAAFGLLLAAIVPTDRNYQLTPRRIIHTIGAAINFFLFPVVLFMLAPLFEMHTLATFTQVIGYITILASIIAVYLYIRRLKRPVKYFGAFERVTVGFMASWMLYVSYVFI